MLKANRRLRIHQETWQKLLELVGTHDIYGMHRIFKNAKRRHWSVEHLLEMLQKAKEGSYRPKNFDDFEYDLATVIYELGGGAALHALHHSPFAFPAISTITERRQDFKIRVTVGSLAISDVMFNIETMFKDVGPEHTKTGITLSMDEIASDGRLCYFPETDEIVGLCEHSVKEMCSHKMGKNLDIMNAVRRAVQEGTIHVGQEVLVAAFSRNGKTHYGARVVLMLSTCKMGSFKDAALIIQILREAWALSPYGEALHGPILSIASDGDPKRRPALYLHCMVRELKPDDNLNLFRHVGKLTGFNLWTGSHGETQDLDYKHNMKRACFTYRLLESFVDSFIRCLQAAVHP